MTTSPHQSPSAATTVRADRPQTAHDAGALRQRLRERGWRADLVWTEVGNRSAAAAVSAADGTEVRRTIAYLSALRSLDGGALRVWRDGDVPVPPVADVREVMLAVPGVDDWTSEAFEVPPSRVEPDEDTEAAGVAA